MLEQYEKKNHFFDHRKQNMPTGASAGTRKLQRLRDPILLAAGTAFIVFTGFAAVALAAAGNAFGADVPAGLEASGKRQILALHAEGVQIYECKATGADGAKWAFREPLATLLQDGKTVGRHFAGPSWELTAGSTIVGKAEAQAPGRNTNDIALLKLAVTERHGGGQLADVTTVQRLETNGGVFVGACDQPGSLHLEPYSAEYVFLAD